MPKFQVEATTSPVDGRPVVFLTVGDYRFVLSAPTPARAVEIVLAVARDLGIQMEPTDG